VTNRQRLAMLLGPNDPRFCNPRQGTLTANEPTNIPARLTRQASQQRTTQTQQRYGNFLQFIQQALNALGRLTPQEIQHALSALEGWLGKDDPLGFLQSLQEGQLFELLGEIAPVIAQWLSENLGIVGPGGRRSKAGGYGRVVRTSGGPNLASLLQLGSSVYPFISRYLGGSSSINPGPPLNAPASFGPSPNPTGPSSTVDVDDGSEPSNTLTIPSNS
jgi:hypothetical protein